LGVEGGLSKQARRLLSLAGASWSFDVAAARLRELSGLSVCDNTIREVCQQTAGAMARWRQESPAACQSFVRASGEIEFSTDGTCVNTWDGWREMRLGIFCKRPRGAPATVENWKDRDLPAAEGRMAFAAIEKSERFGKRWGRWVKRLRISDTAGVSVLADGARWIWEQVSWQLAGATEVLDIYHALEHVADTAKAIYGEGSEAATRWIDRSREVLLSEGWPGIVRHLAATRQGLNKSKDRRAVKKLGMYLEHNSTRLDYARRLAEGRSIGSGQAEGACRHMIGRRLKQTGARWKFRRVNRMATLCCLMYSDQWDAYWNAG
jgi:hypothetical protein